MSRREPLPKATGNKAKRSRRAEIVVSRLADEFGEVSTALQWRNPWQLLTATILSAQCTDERVNMVTPQLFKVYPDAYALAVAAPGDVEEIIRSTGFFRQKTRSLIGSSRMIIDEFNGEIPDTIEDLTKLPGVARKTANVVISNCFSDSPQGIAVDTHVQRISRRLGLVRSWDPDAIENDLMHVVPVDSWNSITHMLIEHGRKTCKAVRPRCDACCLADACPSFERFHSH